MGSDRAQQFRGDRRRLDGTRPLVEPVRENRPDLSLCPGGPGRCAVGTTGRGSVAIQRCHQFRDSVSGGRGRDEDFGVLGDGPARPGLAGSICEHGLELAGGSMGAGSVALVYDDQVGYFEKAGLDGLDLVAHLRGFDNDGRVGSGRDLDLALAGADCLDQDRVEAHGVEDGGRCRGRRRKPAGMASRRHRADEDAVVRCVGLHPDPVAQDGAACDGAGRIHGYDRDRPAGSTKFRDQGCDECALACAGGAGDADQLGSAGQRVEAPESGLGNGGAILDCSEQPSQCPAVAGEGGVAQGIGALGYRDVVC